MPSTLVRRKWAPEHSHDDPAEERKTRHPPGCYSKSEGGQARKNPHQRTSPTTPFLRDANRTYLKLSRLVERAIQQCEKLLPRPATRNGARHKHNRRDKNIRKEGEKVGTENFEGLAMQKRIESERS